jgi:hypothetical protein
MGFYSKVGIALGGTVAQKTATESAQKATAELAQKTANEFATVSARETFQRTFNENVQQFGKTRAEQMAREAGDKSFRETYQKTLKEGTEQSTQEFTERAAREGAEETTEKTIKETAEKTVKEAGQKTLSKSKKLLLAGVVAAGGALAYASIQSASNNGEIVNIKSIKKVSDEPMGGLLSWVTEAVSGPPAKKTTVNITYSPKLKICSQDIITLSETNCEPKIEGNFKISKIISDTELEIEVDLVLTKNGDSGLLVLNTDVGKQLQCLTEDLGDAVGGAAGGAAGAALSALFKGIEKVFGDYIWLFWLFIAAIVLAVVGSILGPIITLTKSLFGSSNKIQPAPQLQPAIQLQPELQSPQDE